MAWPAYSSLLADAASVSEPTSLGGPPAGSLWVIRTAILTYGSYAGFFRGALGLSDEGPWQWLWATGSTSIVGIAKASMTWNGHYVVPAGATLWATMQAGDTGDVICFGYELSTTGS